MDQDLHGIFGNSFYLPEVVIARRGQTFIIRALNRHTRETVAVKCFPLPLREQNAKTLFRACSVHRRLRHQCIVRFKEVFLGPMSICVAMSHVPGCSLLEHCRRHYAEHRRGLEPHAAHKVIHQIVHTLAYMHRMDAAYRYLMPNHVFVCDGNLAVQLIDFVHARFGARQCKTTVGEVHHIAPEAFQAMHNQNGPQNMDIDQIMENNLYDGKKADVWACGVLFYFMLYYHYPFSAPNHGEPHERAAAVANLACAAPLHFPQGGHVPPQYRQLIGRMLEKDPETRISMDDILETQWFGNAGYLMAIHEVNTAFPHQKDDQIKDVFTQAAINGVDLG